VKHASKVAIENINGSESHLNTIRIIADNLGNNARYLYLCFDGEDPQSDDLAQQYADTLKKFNSIDTLRIDARSEGNCTKIISCIMKNANYPWFSTVKTLKCYDGRDLTDKGVTL